MVEVDDISDCSGDENDGDDSSDGSDGGNSNGGNNTHIQFSPRTVSILTQRFVLLPEGECESRSACSVHDRYYNILPGKNRVEVYWGGAPLYINANHVFGDVIATQAPRIHSMMRFWLMVAQHNVSLIVMLTRLFEGSRSKAEVYWPDKYKDLVFMENGNVIISVKLVNECQNSDITIRDLQISYLGRIIPIKQIHYTTWPDRDVPKDTTVIKNIIREMLENPNKTVVHCSAGVGRTGSLIAAYQLMKNRGADPLDAVRGVRECRPKSVQNEAQFQLILQIVNEMTAESSIHGGTPTSSDDNNDATLPPPASPASPLHNSPNSVLLRASSCTVRRVTTERELMHSSMGMAFIAPPPSVRRALAKSASAIPLDVFAESPVIHRVSTPPRGTGDVIHHSTATTTTNDSDHTPPDPYKLYKSSGTANCDDVMLWDDQRAAFSAPNTPPVPLCRNRASLIKSA